MFSATPAAAEPTSRFTWQQCLWLCLPALIVGAVLRIWLLAALPEGSYSADSSSFFETTRKLALKHEFLVSHKRRWLYPLLLLPTPLIPPSPIRVVPIVQHALGLVTIFGVGWIVGNLTRFRKLLIPAVTLLYAVWPRVLWYEHEILAEGIFLAGFIWMVALALPRGALKDQRRLFWFLFAAAFVVSIRPHGRGIWLAAMLSTVLLADWSWLREVKNWDRKFWKWDCWEWKRWGWRCWAVVAASVLIIKTSGNNAQGNWLLLNSTLPLVNLEGEKFAEYRAALKPLVLETRADGLGYAATQEKYKKRLNSRYPDKVSAEWAALTRDRPLFSKVCSTFSHEALLAHPFRFAQLTGAKIMLAMKADWARSTFAPEAFWRKQEEINPKRWIKNAREMQMAFGVKDRAEYDALVAERRTRTFAPLPFLHGVSWNFGFVKADFNEQTRALAFQVTWLGWLAVLGFGVALLPWRFKGLVVLWLPAVLYLGTVFAIGDRLPRFVHPIEWVGWVLAAVAVDALLTGACGIFRRKSSSPSAPAAA
jgi:hypothetical protein